jgi:hypothetical protein
MQHFYRVLENVKNKEHSILIIGKQVLAVMRHQSNIKLSEWIPLGEVRYNIFML